MKLFFKVQNRLSDNRASYYGRRYYGNLIYPIDIYQNGDLIMDAFPAYRDEEEELLVREEQLLKLWGNVNER
ncbi:MAG: hypothetical protein K2N55_08980 [Lachnospiraceae bacterium]|nr:hypothetical protein [Lachnospiraceae bacterium]